MITIDDTTLCHESDVRVAHMARESERGTRVVRCSRCRILPSPNVVASDCLPMQMEVMLA